MKKNLPLFLGGFLLLKLVVLLVLFGGSEPNHDVLNQRKAAATAAEVVNLLYPTAMAASAPDAGVASWPPNVQSRRQEFRVRMKVLTDAMLEAIGPAKQKAIYWGAAGVTETTDAAIVFWDIQIAGKTHTRAMVFLYYGGQWRPLPEEFAAE